MRLTDLQRLAQDAVGPGFRAFVLPVVVECAQVTVRRNKDSRASVLFAANKLRDAITDAHLRIVYDRDDSNHSEWYFAIDGKPFRDSPSAAP